MGAWQSYRMRVRRKRARIRAYRKHFSLRPVADRTNLIGAGDVLVFATLRDEHIRLPYFLRYYRDLGVSHFLIVDNDSRDGGAEYLAQQPDVSLWSTRASYKGGGSGSTGSTGCRAATGMVTGRWSWIRTSSSSTRSATPGPSAR